jgi:hypothetical protein
MFSRAVQAGLEGLYRVRLVMHRRCAARQVEDSVDRYVEAVFDGVVDGFRHIVTEELERLVAQQGGYVLHAAGHQVVQRHHLVAVVE